VTFVRFARAAAALGAAGFLVISGCSSDPPAKDASFCGVARDTLATCKAPQRAAAPPDPGEGIEAVPELQPTTTACDDTLTTGCATLASVLSPLSLARTRDCLDSGVCAAAACLTRTQKSLEPTEAHRALASTFCANCASDVPDCEAQFYARGSKLPGSIVLPYADGIVQAVADVCATGSGCRARFVSCASETITSALTESVTADVADCISQAFQRDDTGSPGPNGQAQIAKCTPENCAGCCRNDTCDEGKSLASCGARGAACETCSGIASCTNGVCKEPCRPENCPGCCSGDTCVAGTTKDACGEGGRACRGCTGTFVCSKATCIDASCKATCTNGCCSPSGCQPGTARAACGAGGEACVDCGAGRGCSSGACVLDRSSLWDVFVVSADGPDKGRTSDYWDLFSGLPDPYLQAFASEGATSTSGKTLSVPDSLRPSWGVDVLTRVKANTLLTNLAFEIWDQDTLDPDDYIGGCAVPVTASMFDGALRSAVCGPGATRGVAVTVWYRLRPSP
jgi:hypothetical protein